MIHKHCYHDDDPVSTIIAAVVVLLIIGVLVHFLNKIDQATPESKPYMEKHKCIRNGFAGRDAKPTFQCDNGVWLQREINKKAEVE